MTVRKTAMALTLVASAFGAMCGTQTASAASPKALVLQPRDLARVYPGTFHRGLGVALGRSGFGGIALARSDVMVRHGLMTGYSVMYERVASSQFGVTNAVSLFRDSSGPRWELNYTLTHMPKPAPQETIHISSISGIGDRALMYTTNVQVGAKVRTVSAGVAFIRGRYTVTVGVIDVSGPKTSDVLTLARIEDAKIQQQG